MYGLYGLVKDTRYKVKKREVGKGTKILRWERNKGGKSNMYIYYSSIHYKLSGIFLLLSVSPLLIFSCVHLSIIYIDYLSCSSFNRIIAFISVIFKHFPFLTTELPRGSDLLSIIKVPSCQLMPHESTFQVQTDLPSVAAL